MGGLTEFDKWLILYVDYLRARGIHERTVQAHIRVLSRIQNEWTDVIGADKEYLLTVVWEKVKNGVTRRKYNQAIKWFKGFQEWVRKDGLNEFKEWMRVQGYSESTIKEYYYILKASADRINRSEKELRRFENARKLFKRFVSLTFS